MTLSFKPKSWEAENSFVIAKITKTYTDAPFLWEIYSKADEAVISGGYCSTFGQAMDRCRGSAITVTGAKLR
jgi:hypothetical protein